MAEMQPVRGTHDFLGNDMRRYRHIVDTALKISSRFGFEEIKTPIFEFSHVFMRTLGDTSDIVTKEMYVFEDRGGDQLCLRPEGTAGVMRAMISQALFRNTPCKFFYEGPMFRYERPQKGRFRQFHQIGVELIGIDNPQSDIECIACGDLLLKELGIQQDIYLEINSIGDTESRNKYREKLIEYFRKYEKDLSVDSQKRLSTNPLRILDSKDEKDLKFISAAPKLTDHLNAESKAKFDQVCDGLTSLGIRFTINPRLVRGLDYYSHVVFEFKTNALGAQDAVLSGGRYDGLAETMGGPKTPAVGWAAGLERLSLLLKTDTLLARPVALIPLGENAEKYALILANELRKVGLPVDVAYGGNMSNRMKKATRVNAKLAVILGDNEITAQTATIKNLDTGAQTSAPLQNLSRTLAQLIAQ